MVAGARRHLEAGHEKYILDTIQSYAAQVNPKMIQMTVEL